MDLLFSEFEDCVLLERTRVPTPEGDFISKWTEGAPFQAAFDFQASVETQTAAAQGVTGLWTVYTRKNIVLDYHDVFRRKSDGQIFRITSRDGSQTPVGAGLQLRQSNAEEWVLA